MCQFRAARGLHGGWWELSEISLKGGTEKMQRETKILKRGGIGSRRGCLKKERLEPPYKI